MKFYFTVLSGPLPTSLLIIALLVSSRCVSPVPAIDDIQPLVLFTDGK